jgi:hypothetical protein
MLVFWIITPCELVGRYRRFWGTYWSVFKPWRWRQYLPPKRRYLPTSPYGVATQKTNIDIFTAVRTSNLTRVWRCTDLRSLAGNPGNASVRIHGLRDENITPDLAITKQDRPIVMLCFKSCVTRQMRWRGDQEWKVGLDLRKFNIWKYLYNLEGRRQTTITSKYLVRFEQCTSHIQEKHVAARPIYLVGL